MESIKMAGLSNIYCLTPEERWLGNMNGYHLERNRFTFIDGIHSYIEYRIHILTTRKKNMY